MISTNDRPGIEERYLTAINTANLLIKFDKSNVGDILIAAGMSRDRLGSALLRLHSEFETVNRPRKPNKDDLEKFVNSNHAPDAKTVLMDWFQREQINFMMRLRSLELVRREVERQANIWNLKSPVELSAALIYWWLDHNCRNCNGIAYLFPVGQMRRICPSCRGTGKTPIPYGEAGRMMANYLDDCQEAGRTSIKKRLQNIKNAEKKSPK